MSDLRRVGAQHEDAAAEFLIAKGFTIVTRRWCTKGGEIDVVALDGDVLVFVEVKARSGRWMSPEEAISATKIERFMRAVNRYCLEADVSDRPVRYDVIAIDGEGLRHYEDAFRA